MPKQKTTAAENVEQSLFADVVQTLPESNETIEEIRADIGNCTRCPLHEGRTKIVHTTGNFGRFDVRRRSAGRERRRRRRSVRRTRRTAFE
jgi:hypothetical protein